ncbi:MAG TPA: biotin-dependent carboxyltransferase family protein [Planctomycetaceae bacterium]|nr:biotin-dependent carboxyltransferase family protein [Planctomycetaceae bacterium]
MTRIRILRAGLSTTVQDRGRTHLRHLGVPVGGAMDLLSHDLANRLVGNPAEAATLEMTLTGDEIEFVDDTLIAITGADTQPEMSHPDSHRLALAQHCPIVVRSGGRIRFQAARRGCRCYVAIAGGINVPVVLGSRSTLLRAALGGHCGRIVAAGDELVTGDVLGPSQSLIKTLIHVAPPSSEVLQPHWLVRPEELPHSDIATLRIVPGSHASWLTKAEWENLQDINFVVSSKSDRMGFRLTGHQLAITHPEELQSEGVVPGTIQVPPDGNPILLMADCAPTGGYPRIGHVITADLGIAAQMRPSQSVRFVTVTMEQAQTLVRQQRNRLNTSILGMQLALGMT